MKYRGFTLIELLVVIALLGVLATVVAVTVFSRDDRARWNLTVTTVQRLRGEVELFKVERGRLPERLEELVTLGQLEELPKDSWGCEFHYAKPGRRGAPFDIVSWGADCQPGGTGVNEDIWSHPPR